MAKADAVDDRKLPQTLLDAGRSYHSRIKLLGLHPESLMWAYDLKMNRHALVMAWSGIDKYGPMELTDLLFKAYHLSLLPREINPLNVDVYSHNSVIGWLLLQKWPDKAVTGYLGDGCGKGGTSEEQEARADYQLRREWVYTAQLTRRSSVKVSADWRKFQHSIRAAK